MFVTFEGVEGCGKTSQVRVLGDTLLKRGVAVTLTREPGGSPIGAPLRAILLSDQYAVCPRAELLLYTAERAEHVERVIRPALKRGEWVLCDRFGDATRAYQSWGRGIPLADVELVHSLATGGLEPDLTVLLRVPVELALERARQRDGASPKGEGRFEAEDLAFHGRVAEGYEALALQNPHRFVVVEATGTRDEVAARVWSALEERLALDRARWLAEYVAVQGLSLALAPLPIGAGMWVGRVLGRALFSVDKRHRQVALDNLEAAYPESQQAWREGVARGAFEHLGRLLVEILRQGPDASRSLELSRIEGWEWLRRVEAEGRGYFLLSGHFGNWERVAHLQGALSFPLWMVARPLDNPHLERFFARRRESTGNRVVYKRNALREVAKGLKAGKGVAFVIDQNFGEAGRVFVPFFGRPAATTPALGRLAVRFNAPILPVFAYPETGGRYRIVYGPPIDAPDTGDPEADALELTARATALIEEAVRACPTAWFWMHQRWRSRPDGE